jgi:hypothetical protein
MTVGKVKDFNFSSGGMTSGYAKGGKAMETPRAAQGSNAHHQPHKG